VWDAPSDEKYPSFSWPENLAWKSGLFDRYASLIFPVEIHSSNISRDAALLIKKERDARPGDELFQMAAVLCLQFNKTPRYIRTCDNIAEDVPVAEQGHI
jgi:hypothetical protein